MKQIDSHFELSVQIYISENIGSTLKVLFHQPMTTTNQISHSKVSRGEPFTLNPAVYECLNPLGLILRLK